MVEYQQKEFYRIGDLVDIVRLLRGEGGCPWDREQTHKSIKSDLIEETCEVIEAIDLEDKALLREELGDVLLQVVFHCRIEEETESFNFDDVCDEICKKLIIRHPHVFGDVTANTTDQVLKNWDAIKMETKGQEKYTDTLTSVAKSLPALMRISAVPRTLWLVSQTRKPSLMPLLQTETRLISRRRSVIFCFPASMPPVI